MVTQGDTVVTDSVVTDGTSTARAISFFTVEGDTIIRLREYWPDAYQAPANRAHLVERLE